MRFQPVLIAALVTPLCFLSGCFGDGGTNNTNTYDGAWTVAFVNPADVPVAGTNQSVTCNEPTASLTLANGTGSTSQTLTCTTNTDHYDSTGAFVNTTTVTQAYGYLISVAISSAGVVNALVNGVPMTGTCISLIGCSATTSTTTLSLSR